ncbi:MAG: hypothetical protein ACI9QL_005128, partial [Candidatus Omnitrophota bacterium]
LDAGFREQWLKKSVKGLRVHRQDTHEREPQDTAEKRDPPHQVHNWEMVPVLSA